MKMISVTKIIINQKFLASLLSASLLLPVSLSFGCVTHRTPYLNNQQVKAWTTVICPHQPLPFHIHNAARVIVPMHYSIVHLYFNNTITFLILAVGTAFFGYLSDYIGRVFLIVISVTLFIFVDYFLFKALIQHMVNMTLFTIATAFIASIANGCYAILITEIFPTNLRYSGTGMSFNLGLGIFAGLSPLLMTYCLKSSMNFMVPYYYLAIAGMLNLIAIFIIHQQKILTKTAKPVTHVYDFLN